MTEQWAAIPGYEGLYEVSNLGRARSLPRKGGTGRTYGGSLLKPCIEKRSGYQVIALRKNGVQRPCRVHNAVLEAFIGPRPTGAVTRHLNGCPSDNRVENLAWGTRLENARDAQLHGTWAHGEGHGNARLTELQAQAISHLAGKMSRPSIAAAFGVSVATVQGIHTGATWRRKDGCRWLPEGVL